MDVKRLIRIKELVNLTLGKTPSLRSEFLDQECGNDEELKNEIKSLILSFESSEDFLEKPLTINTLNETPFKDPNIGKQLGNYVIEDQIGIGGVGIVYSGSRNDKVFERKVAIKILKYGFTSDYLLKRFQIERQTLANLQHPNIARLFDGGRTEDGLPYLVMEYVDGEPITTFCKENDLTIRKKLELFQDVCQAVQFAHQSLVIHRDIKPGNIIVTKDGKPKLLDFGIAKIIDEELSQTDQGLTMTGMWHLTPAYASPEQVKGQPVTTSSDVYGLGVLLYEILTGHQPHDINSYNPIDISNIILEGKVIKPSEKTKNKDISRKLKGDLDNIVLKAIHKDSSQRYASVQEFLDDINRYSKGLPVLARKDTILYTASKFIKRHKVGVAIFFVFQVLIIASIVIINNQRNIASQERDRAQVELNKFEAVNDFMLEMLSSADPGTNSKDIKVFDLLEKAAIDVEIKFQNYPETKNAIKQTLGSTFIGLSEYDKAEKLLLETHQSNIELFGRLSNETAKSAHQLGVLYDWKGNYSLADSFYIEGIKIYQATSDIPQKGLADNFNDYATMKTNLGQYDTAAILLENAMHIYGLHNEEKGKKEAITIINMAVNMHHQNEWEKAEKYYLEAKEILSGLYGENIPEMASIYNNLAFVYLDNKDYAESEKTFIKALKIKKEVLGEKDPYIGLAYTNLGMLYFIMEEYQQAETPLKQAINMFDEIEANEDPFLSLAHYWLGRTYLDWGKLSEAEEELKNSVRIREIVYSEDHYKTWSSKGELGVCLLKQKRYKEAEKLLSGSLEFYKNDSYVDLKKITRYTEQLAILYNETGNKNKSELFYSELAKLNAETADQ